MIIKQHQTTGLWCREDGAVCMPPTGYRYKKFRWVYGCGNYDGYPVIGFKRRHYWVHRLICETFHGVPLIENAEVDHIDRNPSNNWAANLHWVSRKANEANKNRVDISLSKYGVRDCENKIAYHKKYYMANKEKYRKYAKEHSAKMRALGFIQKKCPNGKWCWVKK